MAVSSPPPGKRSEVVGITAERVIRGLLSEREAKGEGISHYARVAAYWYRMAAEKGHAGAQYNLGIMYEVGLGVPHTYVQAYMWHNLAANQGDEDAVSTRTKLAKKMTPAQIEEAEKLAREWKPSQ